MKGRELVFGLGFGFEKLLKMKSDDVKPFIEIRIKINNYYASLHHAYSSNY